MRHLRTRTSSALAITALLLATAGCSEGDDVSASHCDEIQERADAFSADGENEVPATLIGALREVVEDSEAPEELRDAYDAITEAEDEEEVDEALADIDRIVAECGVDLEG